MRRFYAVYNSPFYRLSKPNCKRMVARKALLIPLIISRLVLADIIIAETRRVAVDYCIFIATDTV